ncbi:MAG: hypothetical protein KAR81_01330, partial [Sulfurimonas sp.]|nr:hypothetical protein [Sulfurimonas sp.]
GYLVEFTYCETEKRVFKPILPTGFILGSVEITGCHEIFNPHMRVDKPWYNIKQKTHFIKSPELDFGDYRDGRYVWTGENHRLLQKPIEYKGFQGYHLNFKGDPKRLIFK